MKRDAGLYIDDILESIALIKKYSENLTIADLSSDDLKRDAIIRRLLVIGEASKKIPEDLRIMAPEIPWKKIAGMRDILVHDYDAIIPEQVMAVIVDDLPQLEKAMQKLEVNLKNKSR